jgi:hypothetical protein
MASIISTCSFIWTCSSSISRTIQHLSISNGEREVTRSAKRGSKETEGVGIGLETGTAALQKLGSNVVLTIL